jgi:hypothetical protein
MRITTRLISAVAALLSSAVASTTRAITPDNPGGGSVQFTVSSAASKPISPWIYGTNFDSVPNANLNRIGGNRLSGYNWENNASNAGSDWYHHSDYGMAGGANDPVGSAFRGALQSAATNGQATVVTVPMAGYVAADGNGTVDETEIAPSPRWKQVVPKKSTIYPGSPLATSPNKTDGYVFTDELANWVETFKTATQPVFYSLDNEVALWGTALPSGWQSGSQPRPWENPPVAAIPASPEGRTHPTIHPYDVTFAELRTKTIAHASAIKDVNPSALVFGGVGYGWGEFQNLGDAPDAVTSPSHPGGDQTGEMHYYEWLLQQVRTEEIAQGRKLMDVLDLHWYTEVYADGQRITGDIATPAAVAARVQSTRSLWDPSYGYNASNPALGENSWIAQWATQGPIRLLSRVQRDINDFNPGTKIAITEYNYGGTNHISGGVAQADALGIFGREGVFAASMWGGGTYIDGAFDMYLDYDGQGGAFGDVGIGANTSSNSQSAVYASLDSNDPNRMVVVAINRMTSVVTTGLAVTHDRRFDIAEVYQLTSASANPVRVADIEISLINAFQYSMPALSVTTMVLRSFIDGDFNGNGEVNADDLAIWRANVGMASAHFTDGDADRNGVVDGRDFLVWQRNLGAVAPSVLPTQSPVPEPATLALAAFAILFLSHSDSPRSSQRTQRRKSNLWASTHCIPAL